MVAEREADGAFLIEYRGRKYRCEVLKECYCETCERWFTLAPMAGSVGGVKDAEIGEGMKGVEYGS